MVLHRRALTPALLAAVACLALGCSGLPAGPTYTEAELKARCEMRGGRWHPNNIGDPFCEYNSEM